MDDREIADVITRARCDDHGDGWCPLCSGDPDRCPRTGREAALAREPVKEGGDG